MMKMTDTQIKTWNEMTKDFSENINRNFETVKTLVKNSIERSDEAIAKNNSNQFTYFMSTINQLNNNYITSLGATINNLSTVWNQTVTDRTAARKQVTDNIDAFFGQMGRIVAETTKPISQTQTTEKK